MPQVFRVMKKDDDGKPTVEQTGKGLGVRHPPHNGIADVDLDDGGVVVLNGKGMSVAPSLAAMPHFLIPRRLSERFPKARGNDALYCFKIGEGQFRDGAVSDSLDLRQDAPDHGNIVPQMPMPLEQFRSALSMTRDDWTIDE